MDGSLRIPSCGIAFAITGLAGGLAACGPTPVFAPPVDTPSAAAPATAAVAPGSLVVDARQILAAVPPLAFGTNVGPWQNLSAEMMPHVDEAGFTFLRFPGGNWGDEYLLLPRHVDEFMAMARRLRAEPMIHVRLFRGQPEQAAAWVTYANRTRGYGVRYWAIGNEPSLYAASRGAADYDVEAFNAQWREFALAMKKADPSILLVGPEIHQYTGLPGEDPVDAHGVNWLTAFLEANGDLVDIVSVHRYPFGASDPTPDQLRANSAEWDTILPNLRRDVRAAAGRDLPIAVTEVNSNWSLRTGGAATPDSLLNAIWWADVLGRMIDQQVDIVAQFALEGAGGLGMLGPDGPRPIYQVYRLYRSFGRRLVSAATGVEMVTIYAALRDDGALSMVVVNRGSETAQADLTLTGFVPGAPASVWRLDRDHQAEELPLVTLKDVTALELPAESVTLFVVPPR
jgi:hypothetical protein